MNDKIQIALPTVGAAEIEQLAEVIASGWLTQGPKVAAFEAAFAKRHAVDHALAVTSCTTGLHLALLALGIGPGDEVIVPSFTWIASANAVLYCGATPVLCDIDLATFNIDIADALARVTARTKAVMAVHLFGLCADIDRLRQALPAEIAIIEDAACAAGAELRGRPAGGLGDLGVFSFHPRKTITTGEGGMLTTNQAGLAERASHMRNHGATISEEQRHLGPRPHLLPAFPELGYNYRMTDLQGAVGLAQLSKLDALIEERAHWAAWYRHRLAGLSWLTAPSEPKDGRHGWQSFVCTVADDVDAVSVMDQLERAGISTRPGTHAVHMQDCYIRRFGFRSEDLPGSLAAARRTVAIPLHNRMNAEDYERVATALGRVDPRSSRT
ncbi:MAG: DegT/DnrJ/EryC1/StrS family aminotransferase [Alphaproteobacteria bacterium]|nr:DegT/DnrJ/EryC1/StrS family aminotransferase [Alphaproteobacteria bacterium]